MMNTWEVFELRDEGNVRDFLGICIEKCGDSYLLTQKGLTDKVIRVASMEECNAKPTPSFRKGPRWRSLHRGVEVF